MKLITFAAAATIALAGLTAAPALAQPPGANMHHDADRHDNARHDMDRHDNGRHDMDRHDRDMRHDHGRHYGWTRGHHYGWNRHHHCHWVWRHHHRSRVCY